MANQFFAGYDDPPGAKGAVGDFWLHLTTNELWEKLSSPVRWESKGMPFLIPGPQGEQGIQGVQGEQGLQGEPGGMMTLPIPLPMVVTAQAVPLIKTTRIEH